MLRMTITSEIDMVKARGTPVRSVEQCVYCLTKSGPLSEEHILAAALNGDPTLLNASCACCQKEINENVERPCLQDMFRDIRYIRGIGGRRKSTRPPTLQVTAATNQPGDDPEPPNKSPECWTKKELAYHEHPGLLILPIFDAPGIMRGFSPENSPRPDYKNVWWYIEYIKAAPKGERYWVETKFNSFVFTRLLAKTAHCLAVAEYGIEGFEPLLNDLILGKDYSKMFYYVGGYPSLQSSDPTSYTMTLGLIKTPPLIDYIHVSIRIFADLGSPMYRVIAGRR